MASLRLQCVADKSELISLNSYAMFFPDNSAVLLCDVLAQSVTCMVQSLLPVLVNQSVGVGAND